MPLGEVVPGSGRRQAKGREPWRCLASVSWAAHPRLSLNIRAPVALGTPSALLPQQGDGGGSCWGRIGFVASSSTSCRSDGRASPASFLRGSRANVVFLGPWSWLGSWLPGVGAAAPSPEGTVLPRPLPWCPDLRLLQAGGSSVPGLNLGQRQLPCSWGETNGESFAWTWRNSRARPCVSGRDPL